MRENETRIYSNQDPDGLSVGDVSVSAPVSRDIIDTVATECQVNADSLAQALREVRSNSMIDVETLFTYVDTIPVGQSEDGMLYLLADARECWENVAGQIGLTRDGRYAVSTAHDRQVRSVVGKRELEGSTGFVVPCSEFPSNAINDILIVVRKTRLTNRKATIWVLSHYAESNDAIARILSLPESTVQSELATVNQTTRRSRAEARTLDAPGPLTRLEPNPQSPSWMGLNWSGWFDLRERETLREELPRRPGLYRVRHSELPGLMYVGQSGSEGGVRQRVALSLSSGMNKPDRHGEAKHGAARPLQQISEVAGGEMEVSVTTPPISSNPRHRRAIEATLVAICRREVGWTPMVQLNREPAEHVSSPHRESNQELIDVAERSSHTVPSWQPWRDVTSQQWIGLDWSKSRPLSERGTIDRSGVHAFRVWSEDGTADQWSQTLREVGITRSISSRLFRLLSDCGRDVRFSAVTLGELSSDTREQSRELSEVRYDLIGAHYLATGTPPEAQF